MAFWGMDLTQSDEFCETYDEYMDLYDIGLEPINVTKQILGKYPANEIALIPHNVLFAVAKAEWSVGFRSENVFLRVNEVIDQGENIAYYRSLGFSERELEERHQKLLKFQKSLQTIKKSPKKRRISAHNHIKRLPKGTVSYYESDGGYYGFVVLDAVYEGRLLAITEKLSAEPQSKEDIVNAPALTAIWLLLRNTPKGNPDLGMIDSQGHYNGRAGIYLCKPISFGINFSFLLEECHLRGLPRFADRKILDLMDENNVSIKFYCAETEQNETKMVLELMKNPASSFATSMIRKSLYLEDFFN